MQNKKCGIGVNVYGVIEKRSAEAVALEDDMALVGVADIGFDWGIRVSAGSGDPIDALTGQRRAGTHDIYQPPPAEALARNAEFAEPAFMAATEPHDQEAN